MSRMDTAQLDLPSASVNMRSRSGPLGEFCGDAVCILKSVFSQIVHGCKGFPPVPVSFATAQLKQLKRFLLVPKQPELGLLSPEP